VPGAIMRPSVAATQPYTLRPHNQNAGGIPMKFNRRSLLLLIAVVCFVLSAIGIDLGGVGLTSIGLAAFAGAFLVDGAGLRIG
jgi:hypothetical protein